MMIPLLKMDFFMTANYFMIILFVVPYMYVMNISPPFTFVGLQIWLLIGLFYYDQQSGIHKFLVSLPVDRTNIVRARYLFAAIFLFLTFVYFVLIDRLAHRYLHYLEYQPISARAAWMYICISLIIYALSFPIYYHFSYLAALMVQVLLFIVLPGTFLLLLNMVVKFKIQWVIDAAEQFFSYFSAHPFLVAIPATLVSYLISLFLSQKIFMKKDLK